MGLTSRGASCLVEFLGLELEGIEGILVVCDIVVGHFDAQDGLIEVFQSYLPASHGSREKLEGFAMLVKAQRRRDDVRLSAEEGWLVADQSRPRSTAPRR